jgi:uncharacterized Zn finger protein (UPF0148 family)
MKKAKGHKSTKDLRIKCSTCGRETPHYVNVKGEVRCAICQTVAKVVNVKTPKEVEFAMDPDLDKALNPKAKEVSITESVNKTTSEGESPIIS